MIPGETMGGEVASPTRTVQNYRGRLLRRGHIYVRYSNNPSPSQSTTTHPNNRRGTQLRLDDYIGYNESAQIRVI
jgi:hypothetical protein